MNKLVSICIPAYNAEKYIKRCIQSILSQTYTNFEIIVVDDASIDSTAAIINEFQDQRIKYFLNDKNLGWRGNVRKCYELAKGQFVTILPVDDFLAEEFIRAGVSAFSKYPKLGIWSCSNNSVRENGEFLSSHTRPLLGYIDSLEYFKYTFTLEDISPPAETMIKKECIELCEGWDCYNSKYIQFPEIDLYLRIARLGYDVFHSELKLCYRTIRGDSLSALFGRMAFVHNDNFNVYFDHMSDNMLDEITKKKARKNIIQLISGDMIYQMRHFNLKETYRLFILINSNNLIMKKYNLTDKFLYKDIYIYLFKKLFFKIKRKATI